MTAADEDTGRAAALADARPEPRFSYQGPAEVSGRSVAELFYLVPLMIAAGADVVAFYQVVTLLFADLADRLHLMLVAGLTVAAVMLAHFAGRIARDMLAGYGGANRWGLALCVVPWAVLGAAAVAVRLLATVDTGGGATDFDSGGGRQEQVAGALLFGALYLASGLVAALGEFFSHNPLRSGYRRALRGHRRAVRKLRSLHPPVERAKHVYEMHRLSVVRDDACYAAERDRRLAFTEELKRYSEILIAAHLNNPSATDGMTQPDWRPLRQHGPTRDAGRTAPAGPAEPTGPDTRNTNSAWPSNGRRGTGRWNAPASRPAPPEPATAPAEAPPADPTPPHHPNRS
ncbi:hypothetical protein ACN27F_31000 [Solwaraspora sp. WMMB335]|uniref:hypothetical protein n=1 Tax=Solwaraspora sp. WMMB335 TaxID=3404118 RepID=UPI003B95BB3A